MSFKNVQAKIAKGGVGKKAAGAILASSTRKASPAAKAKNPNLNKVKMPTVKQAKTMPLNKLGQKLGVPAGGY